MRKLFKKDQIFNEWRLQEYLGGGGNGEVWKCKNKDNQLGAIKILKKIKKQFWTLLKKYFAEEDKPMIYPESSPILKLNSNSK